MLVGAMEDDPHPSAPPNPRFPLKWRELVLQSCQSGVLDLRGSFCFCPGEGNPAPRHQPAQRTMSWGSLGCWGSVWLAPGLRGTKHGSLSAGGVWWHASTQLPFLSWESQARIPVPACSGMPPSSPFLPRCSTQAGAGRAYVVRRFGDWATEVVTVLPLWARRGGERLSALRHGGIRTCIYPCKCSSAQAVSSSVCSCAYAGTGIYSFSDLGRLTSLFLLFSSTSFSSAHIKLVFQIKEFIDCPTSWARCLPLTPEPLWVSAWCQWCGGLELPRQWGWLHGP